MRLHAESRPNGDIPASIVNAADVERAGSLSDEEIVRRVLDGDLASFELIMRRHNQRIFRVARSIVRNHDDAEDVLQETYVRAFDHLSQFAGRSKFATWLTRIAVHEASARRRRNRRLRFTRPDRLEETQMSPSRPAHDGEREASMRELRGVLAEAVDALPADLRTVFMLRIVEGLDTGEVAECLELTEANVKVRLHRARAMLRSWIDDTVGAHARRLYQFDGARCDRVVRAVLDRLFARSGAARARAAAFRVGSVRGAGDPPPPPFA